MFQLVVSMLVLIGVHELLHLVSCYRRVRKVVLNRKVFGFLVDGLKVRDVVMPQVLNPVLILAGLTGLIPMNHALLLLAYHIAISGQDYLLLYELLKGNTKQPKTP